MAEKTKLNHSKDVIDIVQFGSSVIEGKIPNDIDIAVIYNKIPLKEQLNQSQEIKKQNKSYLDALKKGIVLYGQDNYVKN